MALEGILLDETPNHWSAEREEYLERLARKIRGSEGLVGDRLVSDEFFFISPDFRAKPAPSKVGYLLSRLGTLFSSRPCIQILLLLLNIYHLHLYTYTDHSQPWHPSRLQPRSSASSLPVYHQTHTHNHNNRAGQRHIRPDLRSGYNLDLRRTPRSIS